MTNFLVNSHKFFWQVSFPSKMSEGNMPTQYNTGASSGSGSSFDINYIKTIPGILKIAQIVLSLITFICASVKSEFVKLGGGWVQFVSMTALIICTVLLIFYLTSLINRLPGPWPLIVSKNFFYSFFFGECNNLFWKYSFRLQI